MHRIWRRLKLTDLLENLNPQQKEAVLTNSGSLLVFAGAGSGKTRVITTKIAYAIENNIVKPYEILAVTFTNKACREMQERVSSMVAPEEADKVVIKTFHSFGVWMLRRYGDRVGLAENFTIYDDNESASLLQQCFPDDSKKDIIDASKKIAAYKDNMQVPPKYDERLTKYYQAYQTKLSATGNVDFADMIIKTINLLKNNDDIREKVHSRFKMILVDEYQDSNTAQFMLLQLLAGPETFICVVGDDDQSIYRFRGAKVENILNFPKYFPNTKTVVLGKNYRCTQSILNVAKDVINHNIKRAEKDLEAEKEGGTKPTLYYVNSDLDEAQMVVNLIGALPRSEMEHCAVIYRTNAQSKPFEDRFIMNNIPYHLVGSLKFYDREEIRDCIALIQLVVNPRDSVAFQRMVNKPARGIGDVSINRIVELADQSLVDQADVIVASKNAISDGLIKGKAAEGLKEFVTKYDNLQNLIGHEDNSDLMKIILKDFGLLDYYRKRDEEEHSRDNSRVENLNQLVNMLTSDVFAIGIQGIHNFLEYVALDPSSLGESEGKDEHGVTLITMHNTKGLEYKRVFVVGMEDEIFPSLREDSGKEDLEEERRICYVAFTRAKQELYLFSAKERLRFGSRQFNHPSRFIEEIDKRHLNVVDKRTYTNRYNGWNFYDSQEQYSGHGTEKSYYSKAKDYTSYVPQRPKATLVKKRVEEKPKVVKDWKVGDRVNSPLLGPGSITAMKKFGERDVLVVNFDNGKMGTFVKDKADFV